MLMSIKATLSCRLGSSQARGFLAYHTALGRVSANSAMRACPFNCSRNFTHVLSSGYFSLSCDL